jgi:diguanylate cyclase (GGDEF)-like protein/putative nucleotidyltransferase with HDIG domain
MKLLLVEDNPMHQQVISALLAEFKPDAQVQVADCGADFLRLVSDASIDCFVLDFNLPDATADQLIQRGGAMIADRPVIVLSSSNEQCVAIRSFRSGGCDFLPKDEAMKDGQLAQRVDTAIEQSRQRREKAWKLQQNQNVLRRLSEEDELTGLKNRRHFSSLLRQNSLIRGCWKSVGCMFLDLDRFKQINDCYGHAAGDAVLKSIAKTIRTLAKDELTFRWGGEEFVILHPAQSLSECFLWAENLRETIARMHVQHADQQIAVTASIGLSFRQAKGLRLDVIDLADQALYCAKEQGRNRIYTWEMVCVERALEKCDHGSPVDRRRRFIHACGRALGMQQVEHLTEHCEKVSEIAADLATIMNMGEQEVEEVRLAGLFHDIGKCVIPEDLIALPGRLTESQKWLVRRHVEEGVRISRRLGLGEGPLRLIRLHNERMDSPNTEPLSLGARVLIAADALASMMSDRSYRSALSIEEAFRELRRNRGSQFDANVVDVACDPANRWRIAA